MPPKKAPSESKQGLVITLVFFILMTLGLGVATYYGFAEQETLTNKVKDANKEKKVFQDERDFYRAQVNLFRASAGYTIQPDFDLSTAKDQLDKGSLVGKDPKTQAVGEDVKKVLGELDKDVGWDPVGKKAKATFKDQLARLQGDIKALQGSNEKLKGQVADLDKKRADAEEQLEAAKKTYEGQLVDLKKKLEKDMGNDRQVIDDLRKEIAKLNDDKEKELTKIGDSAKPLRDELAKKEKELKNLRELVKRQGDQIEEMARARAPVAPAAIRTDWKIVRMDQRGTKPYINLGSKDKVHPQLTFSIHSMGLDGRPNPVPKGTLEVVNVLGDHLSQARITSVNDANRDPILEGDILYNPLWNPTLQKHVAVAGLVDLSGGSRDPQTGLQDFLRSLERMNVVVDAWMDPSDHYKVKGPGIGASTDYLILAESLDFFKDGRDRGAAFDKEVDNGIKDMKAAADKYRVPVIGLRKYLEMIGYRLPPQLQEPTGVSPLYKPRPDQLPPLPPERQPGAKPEGMPPNK